MRRVIFVLTLLLAATPMVDAGVEDGPDHIILWNQFTAVTVVDSFVVGIAPQAIVTCRYNASLDVFEPIEQLFVEFSPVSFKRRDTLLMVRTIDDRIAVYSLTNLPNLTHLGTLDPDVPFADFVVEGRNLYLTRWFDGIWRFFLDGFESAEFRDSSMLAILVTQLELADDTLYVLDEYNGIVRFNLSGPGFGEFVDYLNIPFRATSFLRVDSQLLISTTTGKVLIGEFGQPGSGIVDSIAGISHPMKAFVNDSFFVFVSSRSLDIVDRSEYSQRTTLAISEVLVEGDVLTLDSQHHLLLPREPGGLMLHNLEDSTRSRPGLHRSGPINDLLLHNGKLFTGGDDNPIDVYSFDTSGAPHLDYTMYPGLKEVKGIEHNGDSLIVYYAQLNKVAFITNSTDPDSFTIETSFFLNDSATEGIYYIPHKVDTVRPILTVGATSVDVYAVTDSSGVYYAATWGFVGRVATVFAHDSTAFVATRKNQLWMSTITDSLTIEPQSATDFLGTPAKMMFLEGYLAVFIRSEMHLYDYSDPQFPELVRNIPLALPVADAVTHDGKLYTTGPDGVAIYNLVGALPDLIDYGGRGGSVLDVDGDILVTSGGGAIYIYRLPVDTMPAPPEPVSLPISCVLYQNYPNPFNAATCINFSLLSPAQVEVVVYNLLGQQVRTLMDDKRSPGDHSAHWDGTDHSGSDVASGVYFYRISAGDFVDSRKMILLK
jgi:hypothetical protein